MIMKRGSDRRLLEKRLHVSDQRERHSLETRRSSSRKYAFPGRAADRDTRSPDIRGTRGIVAPPGTARTTSATDAARARS